MRLRVATVFSGIGAAEQALKKMNVDYEIVFACDNGEREISESYENIMNYCNENDLDNNQLNAYVKSLYDKSRKINRVKESYFLNYDISEENWYEDIRFIDGNDYKNKVDVIIGGSPCQSFSIIGKRKGLEDTRGTLFYDYARLVDQIKPKVFIYENVPGMLQHDKGKTWQVIKETFNGLGYDIHYDILNSKDYGIPQDRKRLFVVGFKNPKLNFKFPKKVELQKNMFDFLENDPVDAKHYLGKKGFEFVTNPKYKNRARINKNIIQTQKANQQFNWNGDFVFVPFDKIKNNSDIMDRAYINYWNNNYGAIRQLTYRECLRLMGFSDDFKITSNNVHAYRQIGNSIVVDVLEHLFNSIFDVESFTTKIRLATVFSGIGAVEFALKRMNINYDVVFACDNGERDIDYDYNKEIEVIKSLPNALEKKNYVDNLYIKNTNKHNYVQQTYLSNYQNASPEVFYQDVRLLDGTDYESKVDLFVGGSPCQSFSQVGEQKGLEDTRGTLFYEYARLVKELKPKVFIYENVRNLINHDKGKTWLIIKNTFDSLGYSYKFAILNAADYGIPQNRRRLFVVGFKEDVDFQMPPSLKELKYKMSDFMIDNCDDGNFIHDQNGNLQIIKKGGKVDDKYYLTPKLYNYVMKGGTKSFYQKPRINLDIARTVLKTMGNRHRAGIDNYFSLDGSIDLGKVRMLTEREALRLMGFTDDFKIVVSRAQMYKQAGNSIVVDVLIEILKNIIKTRVFD